MHARSVFRTRPPVRLATLALVLVAGACGDSGITEPDPPGLPNGSMSAKIDGAEWRASLMVQGTVINGNDSGASVVQVTGVDTAGMGIAHPLQIIITVASFEPPATGAYPLITTGHKPAVGYTANGQVHWQKGQPLIWHTPMLGVGGSMEITTLTPTRIAGSFAFTAAPSDQNPESERDPIAVTEGLFDIMLRADPGGG